MKIRFPQLKKFVIKLKNFILAQFEKSRARKRGIGVAMPHNRPQEHPLIEVQVQSIWGGIRAAAQKLNEHIRVFAPKCYILPKGGNLRPNALLR